MKWTSSVLTISGSASGAPVSSTPVSLTVTAGPPVIIGFAPTSGPAGTRVSISGAHFTDTMIVVFSTVSAGFTVNSPTSITTTVPAGAPSGPISVRTPQGIAVSPDSFLVIAPKDKEIKEKEKEFKEKESDGKDLRKDAKDGKEKRENKESIEFSLPLAGVSRPGLDEEPRSGPEAAPGQLRHFIHPDWRPDLNAGTLKGEPDLSPHAQDNDVTQPFPAAKIADKLRGSQD